MKMYQENKSAIPAFHSAQLQEIPGIAQAGQAVRDASQMEMAAKRHAQVLTSLHENIKTLCDRLHPVLRPAPQPPTGAAGQLKQGEEMAPLAAGMHQISDEVERLNYIVGDVLRRLEI